VFETLLIAIEVRLRTRLLLILFCTHAETLKLGDLFVRREWLKLAQASFGWLTVINERQSLWPEQR
jgi:hypothetical protein